MSQASHVEDTGFNKSTVPIGQCEVVGHHAANAVGQLEHLAKSLKEAPKLGRYILDSTASVLGNTSLSYRDWALATISACTAMGDCADQLKMYVDMALEHGVEVEEIQDLFQHAQVFVGIPRASQGYNSVRETLTNAFKNKRLPGYKENLVRLGDHVTLVRNTGGEGVPMVLIHALCLDSRMFKDVLPLLASGPGRRVIAYDLRGHGYARGAPITKSLQHLCGDLEILLDTLGIKKADVYGASYGGAVAQYFALDYPQLVRSITVMGMAAQALPVMITRATRAEENGVKSLLPETIIRWFRPETIASNPWCVRYARGCVERARLEVWAAAWRALGQLDTLPRLARLKIPVLALSGTHDASATPEMMRTLAGACVNADARFISVEGGAHMMTMEIPDEIAKQLNHWRDYVDGLA